MKPWMPAGVYIKMNLPCFKSVSMVPARFQRRVMVPKVVFVFTTEAAFFFTTFVSGIKFLLVLSYSPGELLLFYVQGNFILSKKWFLPNEILKYISAAKKPKKSEGPIIIIFCGGGWGWGWGWGVCSYNSLHVEASPEKGAKIRLQGSDITSWGIWKGRELCQCALNRNVLNRHTLWLYHFIF